MASNKYGSSSDGQINVQVNLEANKKKLEEIKSELQALSRLTTAQYKNLNPGIDTNQANRDLIQLQQHIESLQNALTRAFNHTLGSLNVSRLNSELNRLPMRQIYRDFQRAGAVGTAAFNSISSATLKSNLQLKESHKFLDNIATTMKNTVKWGITSSIWKRMSDSIQEAWNYTKGLDTDLNDIRIVTSKSADEMERFAREANKAAAALGGTTRDYTRASLIYYQQGLQDEEVMARTNVTLKAANVTGQQASQVSEQLTAVWNGYRVAAEEAELYIDKLAAVGANTASNLEELSTAMSKVASAANSAGVDIDQLNAILSTVISVTREAPETIGTAFKTIFARLGDLKINGETEDGIGLGKVSGQLHDMGIEILNEMGEMRDMGSIIEDIAAKWQTWTQAQRQALAVVMAGKMQYSRLIALFDNWDQYTRAINVSRDAMGTLQEQQEIYMESTQAHLNQLRAAWEHIFDASVNNESMNGLIDVLTALVNGVGNFTEAIGGGANALLMLGAIAMRVFHNQIAQGLNTSIKNSQAGVRNAKILADELQGLENRYKESGYKDQGAKSRLENTKRMQSYIHTLNEGQIEHARQLFNNEGNAASQLEQYKKQQSQARKDITAIMRQTGEKNWHKNQSDLVLSDNVAQMDKYQAAWEKINQSAQKYKNTLKDLRSAQTQFNQQAESIKNTSPQIEKNLLEQQKQALLKSIADNEKILNDGRRSQKNKNIAAQQLPEQKAQLQALEENIKKQERKIQRANAATKALMNDTKAVQNSQKAYQKLNTQIGNLTQELETMSKRQDIGRNLRKEAKTALTELKNAKLDTMGINSKETQNAVNHAIRAINNGYNKLNSMDQNISQRIQERANGIGPLYEQQYADAKKAAQDFHKEQEQISKLDTYTKLTAGISQFAMAAVAASNVINIFNNDNLSGGEKFLQILLNVSITIPMILSGLQMINTALTDLLVKQASANLIRLARIRLIRKQMELTSANIALELKAIVVESIRSKGILKTVASLILKNKATLAAAAAIATLIGVTYLAVKAYNAEADALKRTNESAEQANKIYSDTKNKYEELKKSIENYKTAQNAIKKLTTGTQEWKDAIQQANDQILKLIKNYPELAKYVKNVDGQLTITDKGLEIAEEASRKKTNIALRNSLAQQVAVNNAQNKYQTTQLRRKTITDTTGGFLGGIFNFLGDWATEGLFDARLESAKENSLRYVRDENGKFIDNKKLNLIQDVSSIGSIFAPNLFNGLNDFVDKIADNGEKLQQLNDTLEVNNKANEVMTQQIAHSYLEDLNNSTYQNVNNQEAIDKMTAYNFSENSQLYKNSLSKWTWAWDTDLHKAYAQLMGWNTTDIENKTAKGIFHLSDGTEYTVSDEAMRIALAQQDALMDSGKHIEEYAQSINNVTKTANRLMGTNKQEGEAFNTFIGGKGGNFGNLTSNQLQSLKNAENLNNITKEYENYGYKSAEKFQEAIEKAFKDYEADEAEITQNLLTPVRDAFNNADFDNLTLNARQDITKAMNQIYKSGGNEGLAALTNVFKESSDAAGDLGKILNEIDWSDNATSQLTKALEEQSIEVDKTSESWKKLIQIMDEYSKSQGYVNAFDNYRNKLSEAQDIVSKVGKAGKTLTDEEYEKALAMNSNIASYFRKTVDGYKFVAKSIKKDTLLSLLLGDDNDLASSKKRLEDAYEFAQKLKKADIDKGEKDTTLKQNAEIIRNNTLDGQTLKDNQLAKIIGNVQKDLTNVDYKTIGISKDALTNAVKTVNETYGSIDALKRKQISDLSNEEKEVKGSYEDALTVLKSFQTGLQNINKELENGKLDIEQYEMMIANSQTSIKSLNKLYKEGTISVEAYNDAYANLDNVNDYEGIDADELDDYADYLQRNAKILNDVTDSLAENSDEADIWAKRILKMNTAIDTLADNMEEWYSILTEDVSHSSAEFRKSLKGMRDAVADLLDVSDEYISDKFILDNINQIKEAATGSESAIDGLQSKISQDIIAKIRTEVEVSPEQFDSKLNYINELIAQHDFSIEASLDDENFVNAMNEMIATTGMTVSQVNALFDSMGFEATFAEEPQIVKSNYPTITKTTTVSDVKLHPLTGAVEYSTSEKIDTVKDNWIDTTAASFAMTTNAEGSTKKVPKINKITQKPSGIMNNYSSKNAGGKSPGKSSKSDSSSKPDKMDPLENEKDRYHDINLELKDYEIELGRLQKAQDKLFGNKLIDNYNKQLGYLNNQIDATNRKIDIAKGEMKELQEYLSAQGVTFNADGYIDNYAAIFDARLGYVNGLINNYNAMSKDEQENYKDVVEQAKQDFDKFTEKLERYDEVISEFIPGLVDDIQEAVDQQVEIQISKFNMVIELELDTTQLEKDWHEFRRRIIDSIKETDFDYITKYAKDRLKSEFEIYYDDTGDGIIQELTQHVLDTKKELDIVANGGISDVYGDNEAKALEDLKNYYEQLKTQMTDYQDLVDDIRSSFSKLMSQAESKIGDQINLYGQIRDMIDHDMNVVKMVYGEDQYKAFAPYYQQMEDNYNKQLDFQKQAVDLWKERLDAAEQYYGVQSEEWEEARKAWIDAVNEWNDTIEKAIENIQNKYINAIDSIFKDLNDNITGDLGLNYVSEEWELINQNADRYLDGLNAMYEVQKLADKYQDAFDNTSNLSIQQKIRDIQESELKDLRERDKLSKYDIDRANLKYELLMKQIALEEAQQNKSTLRLRRDSQGNYTYQYTADEDSVNKAKQEVGDIYNQLYNLDRDKYKENLDEMFDVWNEFQQKVRDTAADTTKSIEERQQLIAMYQKEYGDIINGIVEDNEQIRQNLQSSTFAHQFNLLGQSEENFRAMTDNETMDFFEKFIDEGNPNSFAAMNQQSYQLVFDTTGAMTKEFETMDANIINDVEHILVPGWNSNIQKMIDIMTEQGEAHNTKAFDAMTKAAIDDILNKMNEYSQSIDTISKKAVSDFDNLKNNGLNPVVEETKELTLRTDDVVSKYGELLTELIKPGGVLDGLAALETQFNNDAAAAKNAANETYNYIKSLSDRAVQEAKTADAIATAQKKISDAKQAAAIAIPTSTNGGSGGSRGNGSTGGTGTTLTGNASANDTLTKSNNIGNNPANLPLRRVKLVNSPYVGAGPRGQTMDTVAWSSRGTSLTKYALASSAGNPPFYLKEQDNNKNYPYHLVARADGSNEVGWFKRENIQFYRTGGYTGEWNNQDGKLGVLHQKELVLNQTDTANILTAVEAIRSITLNRMNSVSGLATDIATAAKQVEQNVHIQADFPNVKDAKEIENALNNLVNVAAQRANRKGVI